MKDPAFAKFVVLINGAVPLALLIWDAGNDQLGANPVTFAIHTTGMLALIFLLLSLTVTPVRLITGWNWLSHFRRMLGLFAFFYAAIHLSLYFAFDRSLNLKALLEDVTRRPFILFGMIGFVLMIPLAITSTNTMIKRLGAARWKRLHQLVYIAAIAAVLHFIYFGKILTQTAIAFTIILAVLLIYRPLSSRFAFLRKTRKPAPSV